MPDINWGGDSTTAPYSSRYDGSAGDLVLVEDNDGQTVLLEWDGSAFQYRGPVEMNGEDISGVGALDAQSVSADEVYTVPDGAPADIDTACANYDVVILQQGATYSGSTTITVDSPTTILAHGAEVDYTGTGVGVHVNLGNLAQADIESMAWHGGVIRADNGTPVRVENTYAPYFENVMLSGASSGASIGVDFTDSDGGFSEEACLQNVRIRDTGIPVNFGQGSKKSFKYHGGHWEISASGQGMTTEPGTGLYDAVIENIGVNIVGDDANMFYFDEGMKDVEIRNVNGEDHGNSNTYVVEYGSNSSEDSPSLKNVTLAGSTGYVRANPNNIPTHIQTTEQDRLRIWDAEDGLSGRSLDLWLRDGKSKMRVGDGGIDIYGSGFNRIAEFDGNGNFGPDNKTLFPQVGVEFEPTNLSGVTGDALGDTRMDDGTNTTHGDPDLCIWNGSAWRQSGTTNTFT